MIPVLNGAMTVRRRMRKNFSQEVLDSSDLNSTHCPFRAFQLVVFPRDTELSHPQGHVARKAMGLEVKEL